MNDSHKCYLYLIIMWHSEYTPTMDTKRTHCTHWEINEKSSMLGWSKGFTFLLRICGCLIEPPKVELSKCYLDSVNVLGSYSL